MDPAIAHAGSREKLLGAAPDAAREALYSPERHIRPDQPPLFLLHAEDDDVVKVENSVRLRAATRASGAPCESHLFERGGNSSAERRVGKECVSTGRSRWAQCH